jgi:hypothetical protein
MAEALGIKDYAVIAKNYSDLKNIVSGFLL